MQHRFINYALLLLGIIFIVSLPACGCRPDAGPSGPDAGPPGFDTEPPEPEVQQQKIIAPLDPNYLLVSPGGYVKPRDTLTYTIHYENEREKPYFGAYITDTLLEGLDDSTLSINDGGIYDPGTRTIEWFIGELQSNQEGSVSFSVNANSNAPDGTEILNFAIIYFPSVPEETRTNGTVSIVKLHPQQIIVDPDFLPQARPWMVTTEDGGTDDFDIKLTYQPANDVTISLSSDNTGEGTISPSSLTFTPDNWNLPQIVTVTGVDDSIADGHINYHIVIAPAVSADADYNGLDPDDITVVNIDTTPAET